MSHADLQRHRDTLDALGELLEAIPDGRWQHAAAPGTWCPAEVYDHLGRIAHGYVAPRLADCLAGQGRPGSRGLLGRLIFLLGGIPGALRVTAPFPPDLLPAAISKDQARALLARLRQEAETLAPQVAAADPRIRTRHFRLGPLNAVEWYRFLEMHHRHHLEGQLRRLLGP